MLTRRAVLVGASLSLLGAPAWAGDVEYRDWRVDASAVPGPLADALVRSLEAQIDMVESLPLRSAVKAYFRRVDVKLDTSTLGHQGLYRGRSSRSLRGTTLHRITLSTRPIPTQDPVLLYLLLLAYLDQDVAKGWKNPRVKAWLEDAKRSGAFKSGAQMLNSPNAFFASSAATVLYGRWPTEPLERAKVRDKLPAFYDWVVGEFVTDGGVLQ